MAYSERELIARMIQCYLFVEFYVFVPTRVFKNLKRRTFFSAPLHYGVAVIAQIPAYKRTPPSATENGNIHLSLLSLKAHD